MTIYHLPCHGQKLQNTEDDRQAPFVPLQGNKEKQNIKKCHQISAINLLWGSLPKTLHIVSAQGIAEEKNTHWLRNCDQITMRYSKNNSH